MRPLVLKDHIFLRVRAHISMKTCHQRLPVLRDVPLYQIYTLHLKLHLKGKMFFSYKYILQNLYQRLENQQKQLFTNSGSKEFASGALANQVTNTCKLCHENRQKKLRSGCLFDYSAIYIKSDLRELKFYIPSFCVGFWLCVSVCTRDCQEFFPFDTEVYPINYSGTS